MSAQSGTQVAGLELERVREKVPVLFERESTFYSSIEKKNVETVSSRQMRVPLALRPGGKPGHFDTAGGDMGRGGGPTFDKAVLTTVPLIYRSEWNLDSQWRTDSKRKAVLNSVRDNVANAMAEFRRFVDSLAMTAGDGVLATITGVSTAAGVDTYTCTTDGFRIRLLRDASDINVYDSTLATNRTLGAEKEITYYDIGNSQIKVAAVAGATAGDKIVAQGLTATPPASLFGVAYHHSDASTGTWLGFDRSTTPQIRANSVDANGTSLALPYPRQAMNKIGDRVGQDQAKKVVAWMHPCQVQAYEELGQLVSVIQKTASKEGLDLYFSDNLQLCGAPIRKHFSWDRTRIDFIVGDTWGRAEMSPADVYEVDGQTIFPLRGSSGGLAAGFLYYLTASFQFFIDNPAVASYIKELAIPSGY